MSFGYNVLELTLNRLRNRYIKEFNQATSQEDKDLIQARTLSQVEQASGIMEDFKKELKDGLKDIKEPITVEIYNTIVETVNKSDRIEVRVKKAKGK
jgi:hypothetical protein